MSKFKSEWKAYPFALHHEPYNLSGDVIALYCYLLDEYEYWSVKDKNGVGYAPAQSTLAKVMNKTDKTIRNYLTALRKVGLVETRLRYDKTAVYIVRHFEGSSQQQEESEQPTWKEGDEPPF